MKKKDFTRFTKRNVHKRRAKEEMKRELIRAVNEVGVAYDSLKIRDVRDDGTQRRKSDGRFDGISARGIFSSSKSGYGFVSLEEGGTDIFIPAGKTLGAIDGDFVDIVYRRFKSGYGEEKTEGRIVKIVEYGRRAVIGTVCEEYYRHGRRSVRAFYLEPDDHKINTNFAILSSANVRVGDKVLATILRDGSAPPSCEIVRSFGECDSPMANYAAILAECEIVTEFSPEETSLAEELSREEVSLDGRKDLRGEMVFTIDGESAKDLDDAVSLRRLPRGGWRLGVHIADVSHYVTERTPLDRCVMARGTSVYFTDKVVPMLPPSISNGVCSLNAGEDKYCISAVIDLDTDGNIVGTKLYESVINSRVRGVYSEVNALFGGTADNETKKKYRSVLPTLEKMRELYFVLFKKSRARGSVDFESDEATVILSEGGAPIDIVKRERGDGERMIEQFMLTANEAVACYLTERGIPLVYRIHEAPPKEGFCEFLSFVSTLGFKVSHVSREKPSAKDLTAILSEADEKGLRGIVSYALLCSMAKARYSEVNSGHFGLGIGTYCHFTSPIRRLSDLATHRIIRRVCFEGKRPELYSGYARRAAASATEGEMRAVNAERRIENLYKVMYMEEHVGEIFPAEISSVVSFGMFCMLENTCEGLIPISSLDDDLIFCEESLSFRSRCGSYSLGDRVFVRLEDADIIRGNLRFSLSDEKTYLNQTSDFAN